MERIVGGIFIEAAMPSSCSHSCRQFLTIIQAFAHTESEKHSPPSVAKISARYTLAMVVQIDRRQESIEADSPFNSTPSGTPQTSDSKH